MLESVEYFAVILNASDAFLLAPPTGSESVVVEILEDPVDGITNS